MNQKHIIIIEDNRISMRHFQSALKEKCGEHIEFISAGNLEAAVAILESAKENQDILALVVDNNFPATAEISLNEDGSAIKVMGAGFSIIKDIRAGTYGAFLQKLPIAFVSGEMTFELTARAEELSPAAPIKCLKKKDGVAAAMATWVNEQLTADKRACIDR